MPWLSGTVSDSTFTPNWLMSVNQPISKKSGITLSSSSNS